MKNTRQLDFYQFYNPSELREFLSGFSNDSVFYEWTDGPGIPSYATVSILTDKKGLLEELEYWEEQKPGTEEYELCTYTECAHLGEGLIFSAESVSDCLECHGYKYLAKRIGNYGFVTMNRMLSLYKVYGLYEKGKDNPYEIVCCLGKPEKDILEDEKDEIRVISWHATVDDFGSLQNFLKTLAEDTDCSPITLNEDDGNYYRECEIQDESPTYIQTPRPQTNIIF